MARKSKEGDLEVNVSDDDSQNLNYFSESDQLELENKILKETVAQMQREIERFHQPALMVCEVSELFDDGAIVKVQNGNQFFVSVSSEAKDVVSGDTVLCEQKNLTVLRKTNSVKNFDVGKFVIIDKPNISWESVGGLDDVIDEIKEVVELPLKKPELFKKIGIEPPKGVLLHGPPGTGKTLLAKAVASATNSTFIEIVGSELVQKFIGEGAKLIKEIFKMAREKAPSIIFIDEVDAIAAKRIEIGTSGEREVQRTFMQMLAEIDGFDSLSNVKIIGCTNRIDILDPAIIRPGRLDRLIEVGKPDEEGIKQIFKIHSSKMKVESKVLKNLDSLAEKMTDLSGAEIKSVCTEAGYFAIRDNKSSVRFNDFLKAIEKVKKEESGKDHLFMFN